jgi:hypothetical protein
MTPGARLYQALEYIIRVNPAVRAAVDADLAQRAASAPSTPTRRAAHKGTKPVATAATFAKTG